MLCLTILISAAVCLCAKARPRICHFRLIDVNKKAADAGATFYGDLPKQGLLDFNYAVMGLKEGGYDQIPHAGIPADYVYRETKRALEDVAGTKTQIWPGIDIDIPTEANNSKCTPQSVKQAVLAAFRAGAPGVILSRKYSEMRLADLGGAGDAIRELKST
jgi:hypothetical protein